ncbi:uroporphyrinogen-III synthase [Candidatus Mycolicibacterium alkanivorans]|uniref:Uroporphyrinogen-III synthase n=1 Tax=Candidatus Mycolicibacterium alkanivorans TaxID=2954114 RepID=A0ABS9YXQ1_9MYCO|nr:uroporphyrinogen-III synthase [Candidatus Mycolicibacterium alkanivorans]MCI4676030.1 uroporphyrinogen-III synthase [Candidatus Mycolicibacterium alkanivorans]
MDSSRSEVAEPLSGFTVAVTAARRAEELVALLERRGATVVHAPAIRIVPLADDVELRRVTEQLVDDPPDLLVVTTGIGFRGWIEAAHGWDVADELLGALASTRIVARGPKARGAVRQAGLCEQWSPESESSAEVLQRLLADGVEGLRIAVQLHGAASEWEPDTDICDLITRAGAQVIKVPVYRWEPPADSRQLDNIIGMIVDAEFDAVSFTSAPAVASVLQRAKALGVLDALVTALRSEVGVYCVGPVTSMPLRRLDIGAHHPVRYRLGALARLITDELPRRARQYNAGGHDIVVRSTSVEVDGAVKALPPAAMALLRRLLVHPGRVVSREELLAELPGGGGDTHAVEMAMARLRSALQAPRVVQTVVKRGYRLALDPAAS